VKLVNSVAFLVVLGLGLSIVGAVWAANTLFRGSPNVGNSGLMPTNQPTVGDVLACVNAAQVAWVQLTNVTSVWSGTTGGSAPGAGSTIYLPPGNTFNSLPTTDSSAITRTPVTRTTTLQNLYVVLSAAPGTGKTNTLTVLTNGVASALSVDVAGAATTGNDIAHTVSVPAGTEIGVRLMTAIGAPSSRTAWAFEGR